MVTDATVEAPTAPAKEEGMTVSQPPSPKQEAKLRAQPDWAALVRAVASDRDRASFMTIYDHYAPRLRRYLEGLAVSPGLAEELTQETLLKLWQKAAQYDPARATLSTWLYRVARNLYIDHYRNDKGWTEVQACLDDFASADTSSAAEEETEQALRTALALLPAAQALVVQMSYFQAMTQREIADQLRMPLGTVKTNIRLAFQKLRRHLKD